MLDANTIALSVLAFTTVAFSIRSLYAGRQLRNFRLGTLRMQNENLELKRMRTEWATAENEMRRSLSDLTSKCARLSQENQSLIEANIKVSSVKHVNARVLSKTLSQVEHLKEEIAAVLQLEENAEPAFAKLRTQSIPTKTSSAKSVTLPTPRALVSSVEENTVPIQKTSRAS